MPRLQWSGQLAQAAQAWASACRKDAQGNFCHQNSCGARDGHGENLSAGWRESNGRPVLPGRTADSAADAWYCEVAAYNFDAPRLVGGSTWHWQGIHVRMVPNDFAMKTLYGKGVDWPLNYDDLERWYVEGEREMGVAGDNEERRDDVRHKRYRIRYPMPALVPSYLDKEVTKAVARIHFA